MQDLMVLDVGISLIECQVLLSRPTWGQCADVISLIMSDQPSEGWSSSLPSRGTASVYMCSLASARFDKTSTSTVFLKSSTLVVIYCPHWLAWEPPALYCVATLLASREICELGACITMSLKLGDSRPKPGCEYEITWSTLISGFIGIRWFRWWLLFPCGNLPAPSVSILFEPSYAFMSGQAKIFHMGRAVGLIGCPHCPVTCLAVLLGGRPASSLLPRPVWHYSIW